jgi:hypothetical protein
MIGEAKGGNLPKIWVPMKSNPSPWTPKKGQVTQTVKDAGAAMTGFYCKSTEPTQGFVLADVQDEAHGRRVRKALKQHGTPGRSLYLEDV